MKKFGPAIAANIRRKRRRADCVWHLDEMVVKIGAERMFMWRAVDKEGEVLDVLVQKRRNKKAALKLLRKRICQSDEENGRCKGSSPKDRLSVSPPPTRQSTIPSTSSVISLPARQCEPTETALSRSRILRPPLRREIALSSLRSAGQSYLDNATMSIGYYSVTM